MIRFSLFLATVFVVATHALGWGGQGHQIVALIAEERLTPAARAEVHRLLGEGSDGGQADLSDAEVSNWADRVKRERPATGGWHYVNIPHDAAGYDAKRDDPGGEHLLTMIAKFETFLADKTKPDAERAEALKFLAHFIGDVHQPLHTIERNGDKGGNGRLVFFRQRQKATDLHTVWDADLVKANIDGRPLYEACEEINAGIDERQAKEWASGTAEQWCNESHAVAVAVTYKGIPAAGPPPKIDDEYVQRCTPVVERQLQKAGVRLAMVLNRALK